MKRIRTHLLAVLAIAVSLPAGISSVFAQASSVPPASATASTAMSKSTAKAQRKAARKEARTKKKAELKKLEDAGVNPATRDDENYSKDLQNTEKKTGAAHDASQ